jgi:hypothetical protein
MIATCIGFVGVAIGALLAAATFFVDSAAGTWLGILTGFIGLNCWQGFQQARTLALLEKAPRRDGFACPACKAPPPLGPFWMCGNCRRSFDTFATQAICPNCHAQYGVTACVQCGSLRPIAEWFVGAPAPAPGPPPIPPTIP